MMKRFSSSHPSEMGCAIARAIVISLRFLGTVQIDLHFDGVTVS